MIFHLENKTKVEFSCFKKKKKKLKTNFYLFCLFQKKNVGAQREDMFCPRSHSGRAAGPVFTPLTALVSAQRAPPGPGPQLWALPHDLALHT